MKYRNIKTGAIIDVAFAIGGENWERVDTPKKVKPEKVEPKEDTPVDDAPIEHESKPKKASKSRSKKK